MKILLTLFSLMIILLLSACQTTKTLVIDPYPSLHDEMFPDYETVYVETREDIFFISNKTKAFVDQHLGGINDTGKKVRALTEAIFALSNLNLLYKNNANTIAEDTFKNGAANCLSLVILTSSMAEYAKLGVDYQQVDTPDLWVRREGNTLLNRHVNLRLFEKPKSGIVLFYTKSYQIDFDPRSQAMHLPTKVIEQPRVLAMFYNNKGADAMIEGNHLRAYAYFHKALVTEPQLIEGWTNLGLLYRRSGRLDYAEQTYNQALVINAKDSTTLENLAHIYSLTGRQKEAEVIKKTLLRHRKKNPYYHYMLGEIATENKQWNEAISHYRTAVRLDGKQHQFYFALSKTYLQLGDIENGKKFMGLAKRYTPSEELFLRYQGKLDRLHNL